MTRAGRPASGTATPNAGWGSTQRRSTPVPSPSTTLTTRSRRLPRAQRAMPVRTTAHEQTRWATHTPTHAMAALSTGAMPASHRADPATSSEAHTAVQGSGRMLSGRRACGDKGDAGVTESRGQRLQRVGRCPAGRAARVARCRRGTTRAWNSPPGPGWPGLCAPPVAGPGVWKGQLPDVTLCVGRGDGACHLRAFFSAVFGAIPGPARTVSGMRAGKTTHIIAYS